MFIQTMHYWMDISNIWNIAIVVDIVTKGGYLQYRIYPQYIDYHIYNNIVTIGNITTIGKVHSNWCLRSSFKYVLDSQSNIFYQFSIE